MGKDGITQEISQFETEKENIRKKIITALIVGLIATLTIITSRSVLNMRDYRTYQQAMATVTAIYQNEASLDKNTQAINESLHPNVGWGYAQFEIKSNTRKESGLCQGDIIAIERTAYGSKILAVTAKHCVDWESTDNIRVDLHSQRFIEQHTGISSTSDQENSKQPSNLEKVIPFGIDGAALILNYNLSPEELFNNGLAFLGEDQFLIEPTSDNKLQSFAFTGANFDVPIAISTTFEPIGDKFGTTHISGIPGQSGVSGFDENGAFRGVLARGPSMAINAELWNFISTTERQNIINIWHQSLKD